jgi:pimeloyl-ACP methyl ester carboxylesterase
MLQQLIKHLGIGKLILWVCNGGTSCLQIGIRHPELVNKLILGSTTYKREGMQPDSLKDFQYASLENMPAMLRKAFLDANPIPRDYKGCLIEMLPG